MFRTSTKAFIKTGNRRNGQTNSTTTKVLKGFRDDRITNDSEQDAAVSELVQNNDQVMAGPKSILRRR